MSRRPLPLGRAGKYGFDVLSPGKHVARCRVRGHDGRTRQLQRRGRTRNDAKHRLDDAVADYLGIEKSDQLTESATVRDAAAVYLRQVEEECEDSTHGLYQHHLDHTILPAIGDLRLFECTPGRMDTFLRDLRHTYAAATRRKIRTVLNGLMIVAVRHEAIDRNPLRDLGQIKTPKGQRPKRPRGLTLDERTRFLNWLDGTSDDPRTARLQRVARTTGMPDLVRFMLGSGLRIGEAVATRWCDLDLDGIPTTESGELRSVPVVTIAGNMTWVKGKGLVRHEGKSEAALRLIPLPEFVVEVLRARRPEHVDEEWPVFPAYGQNGVTYRYPGTVRRSLRAIRGEVGLDWMTPHTWRKTYATIIDDEYDFTERMKADLMGHARFMKDAYVSRGELHPQAAVVLDAAFRL